MTGCAVTVEEVNDFLRAELPFCAEMNISCERVEPDLGVTRFSYDDRWTRPGSIVNGGTLMSLADVAVYVAIFTRIGITPLTVTNELKMNFLRPAIGHDVLARATLLKLGQRIAYASVDVTEVHRPDRLVAHATASYVLPAPRD
jgi:uncharacterized protein (TIGR00369 family)